VDFERARDAHSHDLNVAEQAWQHLQADEQYKAQRCRRCPSCNRVVEKIDGCDAMLCGRNYHGGDQQQGCGARFNWTQARAYDPDTGRRPDMPSFEQAAPEEAAQHRHMVGPDVPVCCDECSEPIVGPRAECVHCASHERCIRCHFEPHPQNHVFRLHMGGDA
jgi:hypothetical protein